MTFQLRKTTQYIADTLLAHYKVNPKFALLYVKTGGGKTYGAIHTFGSLYKDATLLVFTANNVKKSKQWHKSVVDYNRTMGTHLVSIVHNYEKLTLPDFSAKLTRQFIMTKKPIILILDEVHKIKLSSSGKASKRMKNLIKLTKSSYITTTLGLSATPFSNSYIDVAPYLILAGFYKNKSQFLKRHIKHFDKYFAPITGPGTGIVAKSYFKDPDLITKRFESIKVSIDTSQYYPKVERFHIKSHLNKDTATQYRQIKLDYKHHINYEYPIQARTEQQRLISNHDYEKDLQLLKILQWRKNIKQAPVLIFYQYSSSLANLLQVLTQSYPLYKIKIINGNHRLNFEQAPSNPDTIILIQYQAGGEGLDWQWSNLSIFYEAPVQYEKLVQARGRNVRDKSIMKRVYHYELESANTIDSERWNIMKHHKDFTDSFSVSSL